MPTGDVRLQPDVSIWTSVLGLLVTADSHPWPGKPWDSVSQRINLSQPASVLISTSASRPRRKANTCLHTEGTVTERQMRIVQETRAERTVWQEEQKGSHSVFEGH